MPFIHVDGNQSIEKHPPEPLSDWVEVDEESYREYEAQATETLEARLAEIGAEKRAARDAKRGRILGTLAPLLGNESAEALAEALA